MEGAFFTAKNEDDIKMFTYGELMSVETIK